MYTQSFCQALGKGLEIAILVQIGGKMLVFCVLGGEMGVYLIFKVVRGDFRYWLPMPNNGSSLMISLLFRVIVKVVCDFTGFLHARHPYEMGGFYWLINMVWTQFSIFGSIYLRDNISVKEDDDEVGEILMVTKENYWTIAYSLFITWLISTSTLVWASEKGLRKTFYSSMTGKQYNEALFRSGEDEIMIQVFTDHPSYYAHFENELREWLGERWGGWHDRGGAARPSWLNDEILNSVPLRLLPGGELDEVLEIKGFENQRESKRRSSFAVVMSDHN